MLLDPLEGVEGLLDLCGSKEALKHMVLKIGIWWIVLLSSLEDDTGMIQALDVGDVRLFLGLSTDILEQVIEDGTPIRQIFALHLTLWRFPCRSRPSGSGAFDYEEVGGLVRLVNGMEEDRGAEEDTPALGGMFNIRIALLGIKGGTFGTSEKVGLRDVEDRHVATL
jgi:hypothetical protein